MALIETLVGQIIRKGRLTILMPGSEPLLFGPGGEPALTVRIADKRTAFAIARNPRVGLGEAYMDGRLHIEDGDILDLLELATAANPWEDAGAGRKAIGKGKSKWKKWFRGRNKVRRARKNVEARCQWSWVLLIQTGAGGSHVSVGVGSSGSWVSDSFKAVISLRTTSRSSG